MLQPAAGVFVQSDHGQAAGTDQLQHLPDRIEQNAELGQIAAGHGLLVVAVTDIRIEPQTDPASGVLVGNLAQPRQRTDVHGHSEIQHHLELGVGHVVRGVDDPLLRKPQLEREQHLAGTDRVQPGAGVAQHLEQTDIVICLERIVDPQSGITDEAEKIPVTLQHHVPVIDEERRAVGPGQTEQKFPIKHDSLLSGLSRW